MEALRQAVNGGYRDFAWISIDPDLDPLRSRDDYRALIAEIKAKSAFPRSSMKRPRAPDTLPDLTPSASCRALTLPTAKAGGFYRWMTIAPIGGLTWAPCAFSSCEGGSGVPRPT